MRLAKDELAWTATAACGDQPSEMFYPTKGATEMNPEVVQCCCGCPVRRPCLAYSIAHVERYGIWGGLGRNERQALAQIVCPDCATPLGRPTIAAMILSGSQHVRCSECYAWIEVRPPWERPHRNSHITGGERRT